MPLLFFYYALHFFVSISLPSPAISTSTSVSSNSNNPLNKFKYLDLEKGSLVPGISEIKKYFLRFGYLHSSEVSGDFFSTALESAVLSYQKNLGIPATGKLDTLTLDQMMSPRCGVRDTRKFAYFSGHPRWTKHAPITLTYAISRAHTTDHLKPNEIRRVFRRAFSRWSAVIPVNFTETAEYEAADVKIGFFRGGHGDGEPFDGILGILAHAFSPEDGRLHLDAAETWAVDFETQPSKGAVDLESVATHEIGHVLGLAHSSVKEAIMYPNLSPRTRKVELRIDDVEGVQGLYGPNPNFKLNSLLARVTSDGRGLDQTIRWGTVWTAVIGLLFAS